MNIDTGLTKDQEIKILRALRDAKGRYSAVMNRYAVSERTVISVDIKYNKRFNATEDGMGRPELQQYFVARRDIYKEGKWNNKDPKIQKAREDYDAGIAEMVTARDGFFFILYSIPRKTKDLPRNYFSTQSEV